MRMVRRQLIDMRNIIFLMVRLRVVRWKNKDAPFWAYSTVIDDSTNELSEIFVE
jgi:hypothetical protein